MIRPALGHGARCPLFDGRPVDGMAYALRAERRTFMSIGFDLAEIRARAYTLWEQRGRPDGNPDADWFGAEQQLELELDTVSTPLQPLAEKAAENLTGE